MLSNPSIASKRWIYKQYDSQVQANTVFKPGESDAAVIRLREQTETNKDKNKKIIKTKKSEVSKKKPASELKKKKLPKKVSKK